MKYNLDKPIENKQQDLLHRTEFARHFAKDIVMLSEKNNFTIALNGCWGAGKTSLINLIKNEIANLIDNDENIESYPIIVDFQPWNSLDENGIIVQFFNTISNYFSLGKIRKMLKDNRTELATQFLLKLPCIGPVLKKLNSMFGEYLKYLLEDDKNLSETKDKIVKKLKDFPYNFIVFIDDIDRLNNNEIKLLFQLIKAVCNFPNITYVLAYDKNIVAGALSDEQMGNGYKYLEKIVQLSIDIPETNKEDFQTYLFSKLDSIIQDLPQEDFDSRRWGYILREGYFSYFNNLRDVNRYINSVTFKYSSYKEVLNVVDFLTMEAISLFEPKLLEIIKENKGLLCKTTSFNNQETKDIEYFNTQCKNISTRFEILKYIFPYLNQNSWTYNDNQHYTQYKTHGRMCVEENFDFYFTGQLPKSYISKEFAKSLINVNSEQIFAEKIKSLNNKSFSLLLQYFYGFMKDNNDKVIEIMPHIIDISKDYKDLSSFKIFSNHLFIYGILELWFKKNDKKTSYDWVTNLFKINNNFYALIQILYDMSSGTDFYFEQKTLDSDNYFNKEEISKLHNIVVDRLKEYLNTKEIFSDDKMVNYLKFLKYKNDNIIKDWITTNENNLYKILGLSVYKGYGESFRRFITYRFAFELYENIIDFKTIKSDIITCLQNDLHKDKESILGLILIIMPPNPEDDYYTSSQINKFCKDNGIDFYCEDEFVDE